jgi:HD-GYP domain-containing protein (c-di-GMP phosphodiesterase class II)
MNMRFQQWTLASTTTLVIVLTSVFLVTVFGEFTTMSEENAEARFALIAQHAASEVSNGLGGTGQAAATQASANPQLFVRDGRINAQDLVPGLIGALRSYPNTYGHFFGLNNDEFLQVIGVRADHKIIAALAAPPGTHFAVRRITRSSDDQRREHWQFLDAAGRQLGERSSPASYAPAQRPWFVGALQQGGLTITEPYLFASTGRLGITVAAPLPERIGVFGIDIDLGALDAFLESLPLSPNAAILMLDPDNRIMAFSGRGKSLEGLAVAPLTPLASVDNPLLRALGAVQSASQPQLLELEIGNSRQRFVVTTRQTEAAGASRFRIIAGAPLSDFSGPVEQARRDLLLASGAILLLLLPLAILGSRRVVIALAQLARNSENLKRLDFTTDPHTAPSFVYEINTLGEAQVVMHQSIKERTAELTLAREKLARLVDNGLLLGKEQDRQKLLRHILSGSRDIAQCAAGTLFLKTERNTLRFALRTSDDPLPDFEVPLHDPQTGEPMTGFVSSFVALKNEIVVIDDVYAETRFDLSGTKRFSEETGFRTVSMLTVPLSPRENEVIGVLQLLNALDPTTGEVIPFPPELISFVAAMAAQSAVALENQNLLVAQKELMDSMIRIIAGAIDAKSAYTGGHCERVPELAVMLAEEAVKVQEGGLADFAFTSDDEWREFRIGAWLHDCGKVTTPEYVVDKATKLETIYNRIHEVRTRFEVLLRDAEIARLAAIAAGTPAAEADLVFGERKQQLVDDFAFIAECNMGGEFMAPERVDRLRRIGAQTWLRHFDNRLGLSYEERQRYEKVPPAALPATATVLADQPWHIVPRDASPALDPKYGFKVKVPECLYNFGEIYNLSVARGTLTEEERFKINEHIIQTIMMLDSMPFPKHLKRVPEYAGTHHETLSGSGYPKKLVDTELSVPSRIMAIADIFEALTASDRPYKKAKTLSESVKILSFFKKDRHIDGELFDLFLTSGVYKRYGERFLKPEQVDAVDISQYVG